MTQLLVFSRRCRPTNVPCPPGLFVLLWFAISPAASAAVSLTNGTLISEKDTTYDGQDIVISNATVTIDGLHHFNSLLLTNNAVLTHLACTATNTHKLELTVTNTISISTNSRIDVSAKGYLAQRTTGNTTNGASEIYSGGSHGGLGGRRPDGGSPNAVYGDYTNPNDWGSGAGETSGSAGGGLIRLTAQQLHLDGQLLADGGNASNFYRSGGAGGSVYLAVDELRGNGNIRANGGSGYLAPPYYGAGGGGGRVAIYAADFPTFAVSNITAKGPGAFPSGSGTVYLRDTDEPTGTLLVEGSGYGSGFTPLGLPGQDAVSFNDRVVVRNGAVVTAEHEGMSFAFSQPLTVSNAYTRVALETVTLNGTPPLDLPSETTLQVSGVLTSTAPLTVNGGTLETVFLTAPSLLLTNNALLTHPACTTTQTFKLEVNVAGTLAVSSNSSINVSARGYLPQRTTGNTTNGASESRSGGSHGGLGGRRPEGGAPNAVYGDYANPNDWGSGGGEFSGGTGGGLIRLIAQQLHLDGSLLANGGNALNTYASGGAGGGIYVAVVQLTGNGNIQVNGGYGYFGNPYWGAGGGGGRVAVYAADYSAFPLGNVTATGRPYSSWGGVGTVYWRDTDEASGTLIVQGSGYTGGVTPLGLPGQDLVTFNDRVVLLGGAVVVAEHAGMSFEFAQTLTVSNAYTRVELGNMALNGTPPLELSPDATLQINGTLTLTSPLTINGGTLITTQPLNLAAPVTINGAFFETTSLTAPALTLTNNAVLTHAPCTESNTYKLELNIAGTITVSTNSRIDVSGKGYLAGRTTGNSTNGASPFTTGGSCGGLGGQRSGGGPPNAVYGDYANPDDWGSGGGMNGPSIGSGGGLLQLGAQTLLLDGQLLANGSVGSQYAGGGSGGTIHVSVNHLTGTGSIQASGGEGGSSAYPGGGGGGGGGGRVAVYAGDYSTFPWTNVKALPGRGGRGNPGFGPPGGPGTVYIRDTDEAYGTLIIDPAGFGAGVTPLGVPGTNLLVLNDGVFIGNYAQVKAEHAGLAIEFTQTLTITNNGAVVELEDVSLSGSAPLNLAGTSTLRINGTLNATTPVTVSGGTLEVVGSLALSVPLMLNGGTLNVGGALTSSVPMTVSSATLQVDMLSLPELTLTNGAVLTSQTSTETNMHKLEINVAGTLTVSTNSRIDVTGKGYLAQRTTGNTTNGASTGTSGGSYGGLGGQDNGTPNAVYGDYANPNDWGSGGCVGAGGGLVRITAQRLELNGSLWANGAGGSLGSFISGGGSGGGIYVTVDELAGNGTVQANGGPAVFRSGYGWTGGAGGGGRIAVYATDFSGFPTANATASPNGGSYASGAGTVYWRDTDESIGTLIVAGLGFGTRLTPLGLPGQASVVFDDHVVVRNGAVVVAEHSGMSFEFAQTLTISNDYTRVELENATLNGSPPLELGSGGTLVINGSLNTTMPVTVNGGTLEFPGSLSASVPYTFNGGTLNVGGSLDLSMPLTLNQATLNIATNLTSTVPLTLNGGTLEVDSLVAPSLLLTNGALLTSHTSTETDMHKLQINVAGTLTVSSNSAIDVSGKGYLSGRTTGNTTNGAVVGGSGSYGGLGGGAASAVYGDYHDPNDWGSGGGYQRTGGGLIRLSAQRLELHGSLRANAGGGLYSGGSGGGVFVDVDELIGNGSIEADGGRAYYSGGWYGTGGGGGRIAVYAADYSSFNLSNVGSPGGGGGPSGGAGTVYVRDTDEALGTLILDGTGFGGGITPLGLSGQNAVTFAEPVIVRGGAQARHEHDGMTIEFAHSLALSDIYSRLELGNGRLGNGATFDWTNGTLAGALTIASNAVVQIAGTDMPILAGVVSNAGQLIFAQTSPGELRLQNGGRIHNLSGGIVDLQTDRPMNNIGGTGAEYFHNAGLVRKSGGTNVFTISLPLTNSGAVQAETGTLAFTSNFVQTAGLTLLRGGNLSNSLPFQLLGGTLAGTNTFLGHVLSSGTVSPGASPELLTIAGNYTQATNGTLFIELAGTSPGTNYDRLVVTGTANLAGTLAVTLTNDFYPKTNALFTFLTASVRSNTFNTFSYPSNDVGMQVNYSPTNAQVQVINVRPVFPAFANQNHHEETLFSFNAAATDDDLPAQTLTYALSNPPPGAIIGPNTGLITWTPTEAQGPMTTNLTVRVTDSGTPNLTVSRSFQIAVREVNREPQLTVPATQTLDEQTLLSVSASAIDPDIPTNALSFGLISPPTGASINANTGLITWTPTEAQGPVSQLFRVRVTDNNPIAVNAQQLSVTNTFTVNVNEVNLPPTLLPVANQTLNAGMILSVTNLVSDPDIPANGFIFALPVAPPGASLHPSTGGLTWRPLIAQADTTNLVTVQVTDNGVPTLLTNRSFQVIVNPLGEVTLVPVGLTNGQFVLRVEGFVGPDYTLEATTIFTNWTTLGTTNPATLPFEFSDGDANDFTNRFYRISLGP